jgi:small subunit ribosomal protein S18
MARGGERSSRRGPKDAARRVKKKPCALCRDKVSWVDYKDVGLLRKYMSDRGKIRARRVSGNCSQHQRAVALAIRTARELALVPYTQRTVTERGGGRGRRGERGERGGRGREAAPAGVATEATEEAGGLSEEPEAIDLDLVEDLEGEEEEEETEEELPTEAEETV